MDAVAAIIVPGLLLFGGTAGRDTLLVEEKFLGSFVHATRLTVDSGGRMYVLDEGRDLLLRYSAKGEEQTVGGYGRDGFSFDRPTGVATDGLNIYVADHGNHRVNRYDRSLTFVSALSTRDSSYAPARFGYPLGVALSRQGDLFILDGENRRVVKFNAQSKFERSFGDREVLPGRLRKPREIMVSRQDRVYVLEEDRVLEFDYAGNFVQVLGQGLFAEATGFGETREGFVVCTKESFLWFDRGGKLGHVKNADRIISGFQLTPIEDVVVEENRVLILSRQRIGIFRMIR
ncbi:MAG: NHL repeat-containing protein [Ignavibacteriales bacterium]|nr:NHL repeat-containing protein [Ignavibacteriales bacterium]